MTWLRPFELPPARSGIPELDLPRCRPRFARTARTLFTHLDTRTYDSAGFYQPTFLVASCAKKSPATCGAPPRVLLAEELLALAGLVDLTALLAALAGVLSLLAGLLVRLAALLPGLVILAALVLLASLLVLILIGHLKLTFSLSS